MKVIYTTSATTTGGGRTVVKSENEVINMEIRAPKEMGGPGGKYTNPEQIFAAGFSSCFQSAIAYVAHRRNIKATPAVKAIVATLDNDKGGFLFQVGLTVHIPEVDNKLAKELIDAAEQVCPYSNSTRNNIEVKIEIA